MTADRQSKSVPFPEFAPDYVLRFTTADLIALQEVCCGVPSSDRSLEAQQQRVQRPWLAWVEHQLGAADTMFVRDVVRIALKKPGGHDRPTLTDDDLDDLPFAPSEVVAKIGDALLCAIKGKAYADLLAEREPPAPAEPVPTETAEA